MKKENADVARHELIGLEVRIESRHAGFDGLQGTVVDETKHTILVERTSGPEIVVPKSGQRFVFRVGNERFVVNSDGQRVSVGPTTSVVDGDDIKFRPEDRTKKVRM